MFELTGKIALVTGAGQGVGAGIATVLARQGASVAVNDLYEDRAKATVERIEGAEGKAVAVPFDVTDRDAVSNAVATIQDELGPVDILVNNAGVPVGMGMAPFREMAPEEWNKYVDINLYGVLNCIKAIIDGMCERGWGRVITISSGAGERGLNIGVSLYAAGKGGGISFMRHLAMEVAGTGVTANTLSLGMINTGFDRSAVEQLAASIPLKRLGEPEEVGAAVAYLASEEAGYITGQTIGFNGGAIST
jgi:3-oxoacyl-[acyl-carrier protein] reductase